MAISVNGYIATEDHNTDWVSDTDWKHFSDFVNNSDAVIMGRKTFETSGDDFPYGNCLNIVLTNQKRLHKKADNILFTDKTPEEVVEYLKSKGVKKVLIIGGGITNSSFLEENLIDEVILSVHPLILGKGIKVFDEVCRKASLKLIGIKELKEDLVQLHYKVKK